MLCVPKPDGSELFDADRRTGFDDEFADPDRRVRVAAVVGVPQVRPWIRRVGSVSRTAQVLDPLIVSGIDLLRKFHSL